MGACLGRCFTRSSSTFTFLVEDNSTTSEQQQQPTAIKKKRNFLSSLLPRKQSLIKPKKPVLELVDEILNPQLSPYSRLNESSQQLPSVRSYNCRSDIPLQCLDARALLSRTTTSTPASSLDLEWEHETLPISLVHDPSRNSWAILPDNAADNCCHSETSPLTAAGPESDSDWSRVSSANSLEWDNVQNSLKTSPPVSEIDPDTQQLLSEIERLTKQTLSETGRDLYS